MLAIFLSDTKGVQRPLNNVIEAKEDPENHHVIKATVLDHDGTTKKCEFNAADWQMALISTYPHVPCAPGHFVVTVMKDEDGNEEVRKDAVVAWRCHGGIMVPATLHPEHDAAFVRGRGGVTLFPDGHLEDLYGGNYASLQQYLDDSGAEHQLTPFPFAMVNWDQRDEETEAPEDPSTID